MRAVFAAYQAAIKNLEFHSKQTISKTHVQLLTNTINPLFICQPPPSSLLKPAYSLCLFHGLTSRQTPASSDGHHNLIPHPQPPFSKRLWASGSFWFKNDLLLDSIDANSLFGEKLNVESCNFFEGVHRDIIYVQEKRLLVDNKLEYVEEKRVLAYLNEKEKFNSLEKEKIIQFNYKPDFSQDITPDSILLFKYSALTFNSHKIHYDLDYTRNVENYPDLLVHGPLTCTLLLHLLGLHTHLPIIRFDYRALAPMFCNRKMTVNGKFKKALENGNEVFDLWSCNEYGGLTMKGKAIVGK